MDQINIVEREDWKLPYWVTTNPAENPSAAAAPAWNRNQQEALLVLLKGDEFIQSLSKYLRFLRLIVVHRGFLHGTGKAGAGGKLLAKNSN